MMNLFRLGRDLWCIEKEEGRGSGSSDRRGKKGFASGEECGLLSREVWVREGVGGSVSCEGGGEELREEEEE
jgi:hypothetical protein